MPSELGTSALDAAAATRRPAGEASAACSVRSRHAAWISHVREFARSHVEPRVTQMDSAARLDPTLVDELFSAGLMDLAIPTTYGGSGRSFVEIALAIEEIARVCPGVAVAHDVHNALVSAAVARHGTGDQRRRFLPRLASRSVGAFAISEEHAGSDALALSTRAEPDGRGYRLTGRKRWTSNAHAAELLLLFARTEGEGGDRISAFLVERDAPGITLSAVTDQIGVRAAATADVELDGVLVRREDALGAPGRGELIAVDAFAVGRVGIAAQLVGLAQGALDHALAYIVERQQFGSRIGDFQGVQFPLAATAAEVEAARAMTYTAAAAVDSASEQSELLRLSAISKYFASQVAITASSRAVEAYGGRGVVRGCPVEKLYRDARVGTIYEGTSNILLRSIAATLLRATTHES